MDSFVVAMDEFILIDLLSQRHAVARQLAELDDDGKLEWLRQRGELTEIPMTTAGPRAFGYRSFVGIESAFFLREGRLVFLGDNTTISENVTIGTVVCHEHNLFFSVECDDGSRRSCNVPRKVARDMFQIVPGDRVVVRINQARHPEIVRFADARTG